MYKKTLVRGTGVVNLLVVLIGLLVAFTDLLVISCATGSKGCCMDLDLGQLVRGLAATKKTIRRRNHYRSAGRSPKLQVLDVGFSVNSDSLFLFFTLFLMLRTIGK